MQIDHPRCLPWRGGSFIVIIYEGTNLFMRHHALPWPLGVEFLTFRFIYNYNVHFSIPS